MSIKSLTKAQRQIARLVAKGLSNAEIARRLTITEKTVEAHLSRIYRKLGVNRTQLAVLVTRRRR